MDWNIPAQLDKIHFDPADVFAAGLAQHHIANTAYPIGHLTTMRSYHVPRSRVQEIAVQAWQEVNRLGLYVHVPYCQARCGFCEYTVLDVTDQANSQSLYLDLLMREFELYQQTIDSHRKTLIGFDIGGGTPAAVPVIFIDRVLKAAHKSFHLPESVTISIETTPKIAAEQPEKMLAYHQMGIRRISMGIQTVSPRLLAHVGRTATSIAFDRLAVDNVRAAGFTRFNVDVMYGFAHQSSKNVEATLQHAIQLQPDTITLYRMRYKGTRIADQATHVSLEEVNSQANLARAMLLAHGYGHPTYDAPGKNTFSRLPDDPGTSDYLTERVINGTPYLGLGLGAQSLSQKSLSYNSGAADKRLDHYRRQIQADQLPLQDLYHLSLAAAMGKMISVSFYFGEINLQSFANKFGISLESAFPKEIRFLLENGLMAFTYQTPYSPTLPAQEGEPVTLRLTQKGCDQVNGVIALFYAGAIKAYLLDRVRKDVRLCQSSVLRAM